MSWHIAHVARGTSFLALRQFDLKVNYNSVEWLLVLLELKGISILAQCLAAAPHLIVLRSARDTERSSAGFKSSGEQLQRESTKTDTLDLTQETILNCFIITFIFVMLRAH